MFLCGSLSNIALKLLRALKRGLEKFVMNRKELSETLSNLFQSSKHNVAVALKCLYHPIEN